MANVADPSFHAFKISRAKSYIESFKCNSIQQDDPDSVLMTFQYDKGYGRGCFSDNMDILFRAYLKRFASPAELVAAGVTDIESFSYKAHLRELVQLSNFPSDKALIYFQNPKSLLNHYLGFIRIQTINNLNDVREKAKTFGNPANPNFKITANTLPRPEWPIKAGIHLSNVVDSSMVELDYSILRRDAAGILVKDSAGKYIHDKDLGLDNLRGFRMIATDFFNPASKYSSGSVFTVRSREDIINKRLMATIHAVGHSMIMPYDVYIGGEPRLFKTADEYLSTINLMKDPALSSRGKKVLDFAGRLGEVDVSNALYVPARDSRPVVAGLQGYTCPPGTSANCDEKEYSKHWVDLVLKISPVLRPNIVAGSQIVSEGKTFTASSSTGTGAFYLRGNNLDTISRGSRIDRISYKNSDGTFSTTQYSAPVNGEMLRISAEAIPATSAYTISYVMRAPRKIVSVTSQGTNLKLGLEVGGSNMFIAAGEKVMIGDKLVTVSAVGANELTVSDSFAPINVNDEITVKKASYTHGFMMLPQGEPWPKALIVQYDSTTNKTTVRFRGRLPFKEFIPGSVITLSSQKRYRVAQRSLDGSLIIDGDKTSEIPPNYVALYSVEVPQAQQVSNNEVIATISGNNSAPLEKVIHVVNWTPTLSLDEQSRKIFGVEVNALATFGQVPRYFMLYQGDEEPLKIPLIAVDGNWFRLELPINTYGIAKPVF